MKTDTPQTIHLKDYRPPAFLIDTVELDFDLHPDGTRVEAALVGRRNPDHDDPNAPLVLDGDELKLTSLMLNGEAPDDSDFELTDEALTIFNMPDEFTLAIGTEIAPASNTKLEGLYLSNGTYCTQCEAQGFRRITYFPDRPDVMAAYRVTIRADAATCPVLLSNGNLINEGVLPEGRHFAIWQDPFRKPSYLFALVAGDLAAFEDTYTTGSGRDVALRIFTHHGYEARCAYAMDALKRSMRWDEATYGLEYDLDLFNIVAINDFNMGAMENKSLNVFNAKYILADPETATDDDYANIEAVVAHEYLHNWTGNRVTCRDWFQLSLKEGLTVFRDQQFSADQRSAPVKRIQDTRTLRAAQYPEDAGPLAHPIRPDSYIEINNFYTATVYEKGAEVIGMYHKLLGAEGFRKGMDLYFQRHDGQAVTCDDFLAAMADANGADLSQFSLWYSQAGTPEITVEGEWNEATGTYELTLTQNVPATPGQAEKQPMHVPLAIGLVGPDGSDLPLDASGATTKVLELKEAEQTFRFENVNALPVPSVNRGFSAPVKVRQTLDPETRAFLMANDTDPFNRWEAGQEYAVGLLTGMAQAVAAGKHPAIDEAFIDGIGRILTDSSLDKAFVALACVLPGETILAEQMQDADPTAIHRAREALRRAIAERLKEQLLATYRANQTNEPFAPDAVSAGRRALKNMALAYLATLGEPEMQELAMDQFGTADNMTDRMAALWALNDRPSEARDKALADFHDRFKDDPVVIDKWLGVQAMSSMDDTLDQVINLMSHPAFSMKQPNKVRALIGSFCMANPARFHAPDGAGYRFLADRVLELDGLNPQVAARMLTPLGRWRRYGTDRQEKMKAELRRILEKEGLSRDVYEIASKSLG
jgi:aminopeptidase N